MTRARAPVQGDSMWEFRLRGDIRRPEDAEAMPPGTIEWAEHLEAFEPYVQKFGGGGSPERIAERAGFSYGELLMFLGHHPRTWKVCEYVIKRFGDKAVARILPESEKS